MNDAPHHQSHQVRFSKTFLVYGGFNALEHEHELEEKEERMMEILFMNKAEFIR